MSGAVGEISSPCTLPAVCLASPHAAQHLPFNCASSWPVADHSASPPMLCPRWCREAAGRLPAVHARPTAQAGGALHRRRAHRGLQRGELGQPGWLGRVELLSDGVSVLWGFGGAAGGCQAVMCGSKGSGSLGFKLFHLPLLTPCPPAAQAGAGGDACAGAGAGGPPAAAAAGTDAPHRAGCVLCAEHRQQLCIEHTRNVEMHAPALPSCPPGSSSSWCWLSPGAEILLTGGFPWSLWLLPLHSPWPAGAAGVPTSIQEEVLATMQDLLPRMQLAGEAGRAEGCSWGG